MSPVLPALLALGLDPVPADDDGEPALHLAVASGSLAAVEALLAGGARVDVVDFAGETRLTRAVRDGADAIAERLQRAGAMPQEPIDLAELFEDAADAGGRRRCREADRAARARAAAHPRAGRSASIRCTLLHYAAANGVEAETSARRRMRRPWRSCCSRAAPIRTPSR